MAGRTDLKKVKAAAAGRSKKGAKNWQQLQYLLWGGGSIGSILLACVYMVINPDRGPFQTPVNDRNLISHVNRNAKTWRASASAFFNGWTLGDVKALEGTSVSAIAGTVGACVLSNTPVPESFDARERWPECFGPALYNMGNCTASWAIASASALADRFCISNPEEHGRLRLSPQQLLSCDESNRGCAGGDLDTVWKYIQNSGLVSEECFPYQADSRVPCNSRCPGDVPLKAAGYCVLNDGSQIRREVLQNGPVVAPLALVDDFLVYRGGIYEEMPTSTRRQRIIHAVKVLGWGVSEGKPYWLIQNSWGEEWGEGGYAKVAASAGPEQHESILLESFAVAGTPASRKLTPEEEDREDFEEYNYAEVMDDEYSYAEQLEDGS